MATKQVGLGTIVAVDHDADSTYTTLDNTVEVTPPGRSRQGVDDTTLSDTLETEAAGIEEQSEFTFLQFFHVGDTNHAIIDTLFSAKTKVNWKITYPYATAKTWTFEGWVKQLSVERVTRSGIISREVTVKRTGAITVA